MERRAFHDGDTRVQPRDCNDGGEVLVSVAVYRSCIFKVFANVTVYLTADTKDFRALMLIPLIRLAGVRTADLVVA